MPPFTAAALLSEETGPSAPPAALSATARLWIAYSGGLDSHVLLHACASLGAALAGNRLCAVHLDHGLHPDSAAWARHCRAVCAGLGVPLTVRALQVRPARGESLEAVARDARYAALAAIIGPGDWVATAQHQDDQAETLLLALLRGSGVHGLAAMPQRAPLGSGLLWRPLLGFERAALRAYAEAHGLVWLDDPSNQDTDRDRNLLRQQVLPLLRRRWPAATATIARSAGHCAGAAGLIDALADEGLTALAGERPGTLSIRALLAESLARRRALLRRWLARRGFRLPAAARLERIITEVLTARPDAAPLVAWHGCEVRRYRDDLFALAPLPPAPPVAPQPWSARAPLPLPPGLGTLHWSDHALPPPPGLQVGFPRPGLRLAAPTGQYRSLTDRFRAAGIPPWLRPRVPLVFAGEQLIAVAGIGAGLGAGGDQPMPVQWRDHPWDGLGLFEPLACRSSAVSRVTQTDVVAGRQ